METMQLMFFLFNSMLNVFISFKSFFFCFESCHSLRIIPKSRFIAFFYLFQFYQRLCIFFFLFFLLNFVYLFSKFYLYSAYNYLFCVMIFFLIAIFFIIQIILYILKKNSQNYLNLPLFFLIRLCMCLRMRKIYMIQNPSLEWRTDVNSIIKLF